MAYSWALTEITGRRDWADKHLWWTTQWFVLAWFIVIIIGVMLMIWWKAAVTTDVTDVNFDITKQVQQ